MNYLDALILGAVQGVTEFLPISSSGHLVLGEELLGLDVSTLKSFDVVVHLGSLLAILIYFRKDVLRLLQSLWAFLRGKINLSKERDRIFIFILLGTVPAVFVGLLLEDWIDGLFRNSLGVLLVMAAVGVYFLFAEGKYVKRDKHKNLGEMKWYHGVLVGLAQAVAIVPGVSRSGSTIATGLLFNIDRSSAARFSFLLGVPAIAGAGLLTAADLGSEYLDFGVLAVGFVSSFVFGMLSVSLLMKFLKGHGLNVFAFYLLTLSVSGIFLLQ